MFWFPHILGVWFKAFCHVVGSEIFKQSQISMSSNQAYVVLSKWLITKHHMQFSGSCSHYLGTDRNLPSVTE